MKYSKAIRVAAVSLALSLAMPGQVLAAPEGTVVTGETPEAFQARTGYQLPAGWHYILENNCVILWSDETPVIEADFVETEPPAEAEIPAETEAPPETEEIKETESAPETESVAETESTGETESAVETESTEETESGEETESTEETESGEETESTEETESAGETESTEETESGEETESTEETESAVETESTEETESAGETESTEETESAAETESEKPEEKPETPVVEGNFNPGSFLSSEQFSKVQDRIQYNVTVPIEGLPSFITQEMVVGALKCQDESGYPASVTIAQIIQESGYGSYGPGGDEGSGLSYLAFQYCNLFGIKGTGTAGSVNMGTIEMDAEGRLYSANAAFRAYHTYTEAIEDRQKLIEENYADLIKDVNDANTFAMRIGGRWATDVNYGQSLIKIMTTYDLYRLDDLTLMDFSNMIGRFANPCPGSTISSTFGFRNFDMQFHKGVDLATGSENIPTYAAEAGVVTVAGYSESAGNWVVIDHGNGLVTKYMHHAEIYVEVGQEVAKGQQIGVSGTTGYSTGNHLHFQVEENGVAVDPLTYLLDEGNGETVKKRELPLPEQNGKLLLSRFHKTNLIGR